MLGHDETSRLIRSMTVQPPGFRPSPLRVTAHGQQVATLGSLKPLHRWNQCILSPNRQGLASLESYLQTIRLQITHTHTHIYICLATLKSSDRTKQSVWTGFGIK